jgi:hypothetical protein
MDEVFKSSHEALVFAFNFSSQQYALSPMSKMMKTGIIGSGKGLVSTDGAAQAGMVLAGLKRMDPLKIHCLVARYSPQYTDCPCCGGMKPIQEWRESVTALRDWAVVALSGILSHSVVREAIILNYYSRGVSMDQVAKKANIPVKTVYNHRAKVFAELKVLDTAAQREIDDILESSGIIASSDDSEKKMLNKLAEYKKCLTA